MAVPKKRRIGYRLANRSFQTQKWYSNVFNLAVLRLQALDLRAPRPASTFGKEGLVAFKVPGFLKSQKTRKLTKKRTLFDIEIPIFSTVALMRQFDHKTLESGTTVSTRVTRAASKPFFWLGPIELLNQPHASYIYKHPSVWFFSYAQLALLLKKNIFYTQLPHKWGGQRAFLIKRWETEPRYLSLPPVSPALEIFVGSIKLNYPTNLITPRGPTLKNLWAYIKANPNEGYWMYCMWLQIIKKWKRWVTFPLQYLFKRSFWRRAAFLKYYIRVIKMSWCSLVRPYKHVFFRKAKARLLLKNRPREQLSSYASLTPSAKNSSKKKVLVSTRGFYAKAVTVKRRVRALTALALLKVGSWLKRRLI